MIDDTLKRLLEKRSGTGLTDDEARRLAELTHRDEVVASAVGRASAIRSRRRTAAFGVAALMAVATGAIFLPHAKPEAGTMTAALGEDTMRIEAVETLVPEAKLPATAEATTRQVAAVDNSAIRTKTAKRMTKRMETYDMPDDALVVCNSACDADSVISEIWNFLTA